MEEIILQQLMDGIAISFNPKAEKTWLVNYPNLHYLLTLFISLEPGLQGF